MKEFIKRDIEKAILENLKLYPSLTIQGPRQCGKTTLLKELFPNYSYVDLDDYNARNLAEVDPYEFFKRYPEPVIIDEVQRVPSILSTVKARIDLSDKKGMYILSGSSQVKLLTSVSESLAGRTGILTMYPLSMKELKATGIVLDRDTQLISGFMPYLFNNDGVSPYDYYSNYISTYVERDIVSESIVKDKKRFEVFLRALAGRVGQLVDYSGLSNDVGVSSTTIKHWISILEASYIIYILQPWQKNRISRAVKTPKIYFVDTGLLAALLGITTPNQMLRDPLRGNIFENLAIMEAVKSRTSRGENLPFYFFRNSRGEEIDFIIERNEGLSLYEIKSAEVSTSSFFDVMKSFQSKTDMRILSKNLIYAGETGEINGVNLINFHDIANYTPKEEKFILRI